MRSTWGWPAAAGASGAGRQSSRGILAQRRPVLAAAAGSNQAAHALQRDPGRLIAAQARRRLEGMAVGDLEAERDPAVRAGERGQFGLQPTPPARGAQPFEAIGRRVAAQAAQLGQQRAGRIIKNSNRKIIQTS